MKKRIIYILLAVCCATFAFTRCGNDPVVTITPEQEAFLTKTDYGVYASSDLFVYTDSSCQYVLGESEKSTRIQTDAMDKYCSIVFTADPVAEKDFQGKIVTGNIGGNTDGTFTLTILKMENGKIWAWESSATRGYLMPWK